MSENNLTHFDAAGNAVMVDVSGKPVTAREATARGILTMNAEAFAAVQSGTVKKGDVLGVARIAGIMATKRTSELIPLCHPLPLTKVSVDFRLLPQRQDFVATWRYLAHYAGKGTLTEQPLALSNRIARTFGLPCGCSRTLICLDVLQERGLIDLAAEPEVLRITLRQVEQKVDLDDSSILRQLRQLLQDS